MVAERQSLSAEIAALTLHARSTSAKLRDDLKAIFGINRAYLRLFFDAAGNLKPEARTVLLDLIKESDLGAASPDLENGTLQLLEGKRWMVLHVFGRFKLPEGRVRQLENDLRQARETEE